MCTLIAFHRVWRDAPLVVATNRDERYDRPSSGPRWQGDVLAPRDDRAGGTWMGANRSGLWVGLTNRRSPEGEDPSRRSRGLLCAELLVEETAAGVAERVADLAEPYNPFHLLASDGRRLVLVEYDRGRAVARRLAPGCHLVTNRPFDEAGEEPKARRVWRLLYAGGLWPAARGGDAPAELESRLGSVLADHGAEGRDAVCLHGGVYGTRSAAVWRVARGADPSAGARVSLAWADGPPCSTALEAVAPR